MEQLSPNVLLVPKNPEIFNVRTSLRFNTFLLVAIAVLGIWLYQLLSSFPASHFPVNPEISLSIIELCIALVVARGYFRLRALQCIERQRGIFAHIESFRTIPGESSSRAGIFLSLPAITLIPHKGSVWSYLLCLLLLILLLFIPPLIGMLAVAGLFLFLLTMLILIAFFVFLFVYIALSLLKTEITIEVTEHGLQIEKKGYQSMKKSLNWDEARLFACYKLPGSFPGQKIMYYELSSSMQVITWMSIPDSPSFLTIWRPLLSIGEYHHQMQALCELITERTGLPLCDLNELLKREGLDSRN